MGEMTPMSFHMWTKCEIYLHLVAVYKPARIAPKPANVNKLLP
jgi:hypothetical protein